jgi:hypothetical protein
MAAVTIRDFRALASRAGELLDAFDRLVAGLAWWQPRTSPATVHAVQALRRRLAALRAELDRGRTSPERVARLAARVSQGAAELGLRIDAYQRAMARAAQPGVN